MLKFIPRQVSSVWQWGEERIYGNNQPNDQRKAFHLHGPFGDNACQARGNGGDADKPQERHHQRVYI